MGGDAGSVQDIRFVRSAEGVGIAYAVHAVTSRYSHC